MGRLIDVDALLDGLEKLYRRRELNAAYNGYRGSFVTWNDAICAIKDAPTVSSQRIRGHWRVAPIACYGGGTLTEFECSECKVHQITVSNFCPNCGVDMREERDG